MEKSLFEQVGGTYTQVGDYLLPNLTLTEEAQKSIGIWGQQHARYLKQYLLAFHNLWKYRIFHISFSSIFSLIFDL